MLVTIVIWSKVQDQFTVSAYCGSAKLQREGFASRSEARSFADKFASMFHVNPVEICE